jgi:hypothetical protein
LSCQPFWGAQADPLWQQQDAAIGRLCVLERWRLKIAIFPCNATPPLLRGDVIKLSIRALILEETLLKKGFFQTIFLKLLKVFGNRDPLWRGFKGKTLFQKGFPLELMTLPY